MIDVQVSRTSNMDQAEVPDCADESLPLSIERSVRSIEVSVSASGVWAQESHEFLMDWFYNSERKRVRIGNTNAAVGDTEYESGFAYLTQLPQSRTKGQKVQIGNLDMVFDGTPTRIVKP